MTFWHNDTLSAFMPPDLGLSKLWRLWARPDAGSRSGHLSCDRPAGPALCVARSSALEGACEWLGTQGITCERYGDLACLLNGARNDLRGWSMLLLAVDDLGGITAVIDDLLALRRHAPDLPVLLFSTEVRGDDLSTDRLMLCDATLRLPVTPARFGAALADAAGNNILWLDRLAASRT